MANEAHLAILKQGVAVWNQWREANPVVTPSLRGAYLRSANLGSANLGSANLSSANLRSAHLSDADLSRADLRSAHLSRADLSRADLSGADLRSTNFRSADLNRADLIGVDLSRADLSRAVLREADLSSANLRTADLSRADLSRADLSRADLTYADFSGADLSGTNFTGTLLGWTALGNVNLSEVQGLETVNHVGPSTIGIDTIYNSKGNIPYKFLLDAGVPQDDIVYLLSLAGKAIDFYSCFISYSSQDQAFAERLHADLQGKGIRTWFAPEDMKIGAKIRSTIDRSIQIHDKLLLIMTRDALQSGWVESEVEAALAEERERKRQGRPDETVLFPIRLDETVMNVDAAWAKEIKRTRHIGDFTNWKDHDVYQKAFARLLRALKATKNDKESEQ